MATNFYGDSTGASGSVGTNTIIHFYDRAGIEAANAKSVYAQFADAKQMPKNYGKTFKISKFLPMYDRLATDADFAKFGYLTNRTVTAITSELANNVSLAEGAGAVNKQALTKITVSTEMARYGEMMDYTDEVELFSEDSVQRRYRVELGELANIRNEDLVQLDMLATTTVLRAGSATANNQLGATQADGSDDGDSKVSYDLIRRASRTLMRNRAKKRTKVVVGSTKIDTRTVAPAYYAIVGADVKADLEMVTRGSTYEKDWAFIPAHQYASVGELAEGEVGQIHEVKFIESETALTYAGSATATDNGAVPPQNYVGSLAISNATDLTSANAADRGTFTVYPILFPTEGAFATVGLKGRGKIKFHASPPGNITNENPYGTTGLFSYNFFYGGLILEEEKLLKVNVCASA